MKKRVSSLGFGRLKASTVCLCRQMSMVLVALMVALSVHGQSTIAGRVADARSGNVVPYANCVLLSVPDSLFLRGTITDEQGAFHFDSVADAPYLLRVSAVGYSPFFQLVEPPVAGKHFAVSIKPEATMLAEVSVKADKPIYSADGEKMFYNVESDASVQNGTLSDALQNAPGVEVDAEGNITLRGQGGVEVWINDRPSHLNDEVLKQYIKQVPAGAVERIEVITNPSARYSAGGAVINIVTNQKVTRNELLCLGVRGTTQPTVAPWASYVWANERVSLNVYVNAVYSKSQAFREGSSTLYNPITADTSRHQSHFDTNGHSYLGGYTGLNLNWQISEHTSLMAWAGFYPYRMTAQFISKFDYLEYSPMRNLGYRQSSNTDNALTYGFYGGTWLEHQFDTSGRKLSLSVNAATNREGGTMFENFAYHDPSCDTLWRRHVEDGSNPSIGIELNYEHPLKNNWELAAGLSASASRSDELKTLDTLASGQYQQVVLRSYNGLVEGGTNALYATVQKRLGGFTAKLGLRGEMGWLQSQWQYADGSGRSSVDTTYFCPVPSIHFSYQTKSLASYTFSYTRRYSSADRSSLNPFCRYDDYSYSTGNPNLSFISFAHNVEASWSKYLPTFGMLSLNAYFRANTNEVSTMTAAGYAPAYFPASQLVNYSYPDNIGSSHIEGINANITYRPTAMFNVRLDGSVYNYAYSYNGFADSKLSYNTRLNVWAKVWQKLELFANASYSSPRLGLYSLSVPSMSVDLGLSSDLFDRRLSLYLNVNDIFATSQWGSNTTAPTYQTTGTTRFSSRFVALGLTWRLGKMDLERMAKQGAQEINAR